MSQHPLVVRRVALIHGGLYDGMTPDRFWRDPGISGGLEAAGFEVHTPARTPRPASWEEEVDHLAGQVPADALIVAGSNGCSAAVLLVLRRRIGTGLVLCWPATSGDREADMAARRLFQMVGVTDDIQDRLLAGDTLRGISDSELEALAIPTCIVPSEPENPTHRSVTAERLGRLISGAVVTRGSPESPAPSFSLHRDALLAQLIGILTAEVHRELDH